MNRTNRVSNENCIFLSNKRLSSYQGQDNGEAGLEALERVQALEKRVDEIETVLEVRANPQDRSGRPRSAGFTFFSSVSVFNRNRPKVKNQSELVFRSHDWLLTNQRPAFPDSVGSWSTNILHFVFS